MLSDRILIMEWCRFGWSGWSLLLRKRYIRLRGGPSSSGKCLQELSVQLFALVEAFECDLSHADKSSVHTSPILAGRYERRVVACHCAHPFSSLMEAIVMDGAVIGAGR